LTGNLRISGQAIVSNTNLNFLCEPASALPCVEAVEGNVFAGVSQTGDFTAVANTWGTVKDLSQANQPIGVDFLLLDFITFPIAPTFHIDLTSISQGDFPATDCFAAPAGGQICTPPGSAFNLSNGTDSLGRINSTANFQVAGRGYVGSMATGYSLFTGTYSADFNVPYQQLLADLAANNGTGTVTAPYSARFDFTPFTAIPEPGSVSLMLAGVAALATTKVLRRKR
jgi:PEP-CTERM motif